MEKVFNWEWVERRLYDSDKDFDEWALFKVKAAFHMEAYDSPENESIESIEIK